MEKILISKSETLVSFGEDNYKLLCNFSVEKCEASDFTGIENFIFEIKKENSSEVEVIKIPLWAISGIMIMGKRMTEVSFESSSGRVILELSHKRFKRFTFDVQLVTGKLICMVLESFLSDAKKFFGPHLN